MEICIRKRKKQMNSGMQDCMPPRPSSVHIDKESGLIALEVQVNRDCFNCPADKRGVIRHTWRKGSRPVTHSAR